MGFLVNIVAADEDEIEALGAAEHPVDEWSGIEAREIDIAKLAALHCLLTDDGFDEALSAYESAYAAGDEGPWVLRLPDAVAGKLARLDEEALAQVGEELAASEEFESTGWAVEEVQALVADLADLARLADSQGQVIFVWLHPLLT
jgi:hypothetical protein